MDKIPVSVGAGMIFGGILLSLLAALFMPQIRWKEHFRTLPVLKKIQVIAFCIGLFGLAIVGVSVMIVCEPVFRAGVIASAVGFTIGIFIES